MSAASNLQRTTRYPSRQRQTQKSEKRVADPPSFPTKKTPSSVLPLPTSAACISDPFDALALCPFCDEAWDSPASLSQPDPVQCSGSSSGKRSSKPHHHCVHHGCVHPALQTLLKNNNHDNVDYFVFASCKGKEHRDECTSAYFVGQGPMETSEKRVADPPSFPTKKTKYDSAGEDTDADNARTESSSTARDESTELDTDMEVDEETEAINPGKERESTDYSSISPSNANAPFDSASTKTPIIFSDPDLHRILKDSILCRHISLISVVSDDSLETARELAVRLSNNVSTPLPIHAIHAINSRRHLVAPKKSQSVAVRVAHGEKDSWWWASVDMSNLHSLKCVDERLLITQLQNLAGDPFVGYVILFNLTQTRSAKSLVDALNVLVNNHKTVICVALGKLNEQVELLLKDNPLVIRRVL
ncbi:hypothetical protein MKEN_00109200 [Mycena kentingensis (nom. inval.)]|nr:hypothetical protein MKEN_00109200 [Mycena kentingensis (nom. inval.)]